MALHNDEPTLHDRLSRAWLVREVGDAVATCEPPQVFGIHGDWGLGKTSFLHQLQFYLTGDCPAQGEAAVAGAAPPCIRSDPPSDHVQAVWFEAWRYQHESVPVVALLQEIRSQLAWHIKLRSGAAKLTEVVIRGTLLALEDITKKIGIQASKLQEAGEKWERDHLATALPSHTMRAFLADAIGKLLPAPQPGKPTPRLVVLIDDLDRCEGEAAFRLLEGLKIYLTLGNCVFVLGMNRRVIEDAIGAVVPGADSEVRARRATAYLEKLCQNLWHLPGVERPADLLIEWLGEVGGDSLLQQSVKAVLDRVDDIAVGRDDALRLECLPPNPRRIKGLSNLLRRMAPVLRHQIARNPAPEYRDEETRRLLIVAYIYQFHPDLYRRWEASPDLYQRIKDWVRGIKPKGSAQVSLEPSGDGSTRDDSAVAMDLPFLASLTLPAVILPDLSTPTPSYLWSNAFPDPTESNVFWIQPLIHQLDDSVVWQDFLPYLRARGAAWGPAT